MLLLACTEACLLQKEITELSWLEAIVHSYGRSSFSASSPALGVTTVFSFSPSLWWAGLAHSTSPPTAALGWPVSLILATPVVYSAVSLLTVVLICSSPKNNDVEPLCKSLFAIPVSPLMKCVFISFGQFLKIGLLVLLLLSYDFFLYSRLGS